MSAARNLDHKDQNTKEEIETRGVRHLSNNEELRNHHIALKLFQIQMPKCQFKNMINNSQSNMVSPENRNPMTARPEYSKAAEKQDNDLKVNFVETIEVLKVEIKNPLKKLKKIRHSGTCL